MDCRHFITTRPTRTNRDFSAIRCRRVYEQGPWQRYDADECTNRAFTVRRRVIQQRYSLLLKCTCSYNEINYCSCRQQEITPERTHTKTKVIIQMRICLISSRNVNEIEHFKRITQYLNSDYLSG